MESESILYLVSLMINVLLKKIVWIFWILFLILGWTIYGQPIIIDNYLPNEPEITVENQNSNPYNRESSNNNNFTNDQYWSPQQVSQNTKMCDVIWASRNTLWICRCPKWTKQIEKKCVPCSDPWVCCGIELNTKVPFIGNCIEFGKKDISDSENEISATQEEAFPKLMGWLMRILVTIIMLWSFVAILAGGVMISAAWPDEQRATKGKKLIIDVVIALAILGASGVILRLINPNFFQ